MNVAVMGAIIAAAVVAVTTSAQAQSHYYRHRQVAHAGPYPGQLYNYAPSSGYDAGYPSSDTAAALDE
jgi:hypothetical protein